MQFVHPVIGPLNCIFGPFHMATRNLFGAFTCALKLVSKRFETGLTKPALHQVSLETVS